MKNDSKNKCTTVNVEDFKQYGDGFDMCGGGRCPRILKNENGDAIIQGYSLSLKNISELNIPDGENVIYLPKEVLAQLKIRFE